jgi:hypothetical protein
MADPNVPDPSSVAQSAAYAEQLAAAMKTVETSVRALSEGFSRMSESQTVLTEAGQKMAANMQSIITSATDFSGIQTNISKVIEQVAVSVGGISKQYQELKLAGQEINLLAQIHAEREREISEIMKKQVENSQSYFTQAKQYMNDLVKQAEQTNPRTVAAARTADMAMGVSEGAKAGWESITSGIPFGGLLGLMFTGKAQETKFAAAGHEIAQEFLSMGGAADRTAGQFSNLAKSYANIFGRDMTKELGAAMQGLAAGGITAQEAIAGKNPILESMGLGKTSLADATMRADSLFGVAYGTISKLVGVIHGELGGATNQAYESMVKYGMAAREAGMNSAAFLSSVLQNTATLKTYHVAVDDVAEAQFKLARGMKDMPNSNPQYAAQIAATQMAGALQGIGGMGVGLSAVVGERVGQALAAEGRLKKGDEPKALDAWLAMQTGFRGQQKNMPLDEIVRQTAKIATDATSNRGEQVYMLTKQGFGTEGAIGILNIAKELKEKGPNAQLSDEQKELLRSANMTASQKTDEMMAILNGIKMAIADMGSALIRIIVNAIHGVIDAIMYLANVIPGAGGTASNRDFYAKSMGQDLKGIEGGFHDLGQALKAAGSRGKEFAGMFGGDRPWLAPGEKDREVSGSTVPSPTDAKTGMSGAATYSHAELQRQGEMSMLHNYLQYHKDIRQKMGGKNTDDAQQDTTAAAIANAVAKHPDLQSKLDQAMQNGGAGDIDAIVQIVVKSATSDGKGPGGKGAAGGR